MTRCPPGQTRLSNQKLADWSESRQRQCLTEGLIDLDLRRITVELCEWGPDPKRPIREAHYEKSECTTWSAFQSSSSFSSVGRTLSVSIGCLCAPVKRQH